MSGGGRRSSPRSSADRQRASSSQKTGTKGTGGSAKGSDPCDLSFEVDLQGVQQAALGSVAVGQNLEVAITRAGGYETVVCRLPNRGGVVGALAAFPGLAALIACIRQDHEYIATVVRIERGRCRVSVSRA
jgi:hypothetical protein